MASSSHEFGIALPSESAIKRNDGGIVETAIQEINSQVGSVYSWDNINVYTAKPPPGYTPETAAANRDPHSQNSGRKCCSKGSESVKHILKNVSGVVRPGELLALMGASGAGKTSLLNVLHYDSGKLHVEGDRCINGTPVGSNYISTISAYVQQDDLFIPTLTVREHLIFTARIRMDTNLSYKERVLRVDNAIHDLGLTKCQHSRIGDPAVEKGISGGEMKRLAFAAEFLTDPSILFCDEPTSGLDAFMAQSVVEVMRKMTKLGKAIICTIHQPASEVFEMFDHIYLLSAGRVAYSGTIDEALDFFAEVGYPSPLNHNPADFFIFTLAIVPGEEEECQLRTDAICAAYAKSPKAAAIQEIAKYRRPVLKGDPDLVGKGCCSGQIYRSGWWTQFNALIRRSLTSTFREPILFGARLFQTISMSLIVGLIFYQQPLNQSGTKNICGCLFVLCLNMTIMNCFGVIFTFSGELPIFLREHWNGMYRADTYFLAKSTAELPFISGFAVLFNAICYYMIGLKEDFWNFFICGVVCVMVANVSASFGYLMSTVSKDLVIALAITPPLLVPIFLFSGFFLRDEATPDHFKFAKYISWFYYGCELLFVNQWENIKAIQNPKKLPFFLGDGKQVLAFFGYQEKNWERDFAGLLVLVVSFRILAYLCLLAKTYSRK